jgi:hypothetical protein
VRPGAITLEALRGVAPVEDVAPDGGAPDGGVADSGAPDDAGPVPGDLDR